MCATESDTRRLFFALWPDGAVRERIEAALAGYLSTGRLRGRRVPSRNLHLTLAFLGEVSAEHYRCLHDAAARIRARPFELVLSHIGHFKRAQILWLGAEATPKHLLELVEGLRTALEACGGRAERRAFKAHVTLMRKVPPPVRRHDVIPIPWRVSRFCLVEAELDKKGAHYRVLHEYPLQAPPPLSDA